jgi:hypothetical protein
VRAKANGGEAGRLQPAPARGDVSSSTPAWDVISGKGMLQIAEQAPPPPQPPQRGLLSRLFGRG